MAELPVPAQANLAIQMQPILLTSADAARVLGIGERQLWELTKRKDREGTIRGEIAAVNIGTGTERKSLRYLPEDLLAWARSRRIDHPDRATGHGEPAA